MPAKQHPLDWLLPELKARPDFVSKPMFGCKAVYLRGRLVLVLAARVEPWNGVLCPTEREHHVSLRHQFETLMPHPILPKWLYLSMEHDGFEQTALKLVDCILAGDGRIGIEPGAKNSKRRPKLT